MTATVLALHGISKNYGGLRPLRIERLAVFATDCVAIAGLDGPMAETFVNLVTGASLPDRGTIAVFERGTADIVDSDEWLTIVDRFGIVSERVVLLEGMNAVQNLALPFTLDIEPPGGEPLTRAQALAREVGLDQDLWELPVAKLDGLSRTSVRLARAIAHDPALLLLEHPTSAVERRHVAVFAARVAAVAKDRAMAVVAISADNAFVDAFPGRVLRVNPATGKVEAPRRWFGRRV